LSSGATMFSKLSRIVPLALSAALAAGAAGAAPILANGGFEGGFGPVTVDIWTNAFTPNGWTPNFAFAAEPANNHQVADSLFAHTGTGALALGNPDSNSGAELGQDFADIAGHTYIVDFWSAIDTIETEADPNGLLRITAGAGSFTVQEGDASFAYAHHSFSFLGSGHDSLSILAATNVGSWLIDDVSVRDNGGAGGLGVPEPATWALMILGFGGVGGLLRRRHARPAIA
jgi:hypothetical protein